MNVKLRYEVLSAQGAARNVVETGVLRPMDANLLEISTMRSRVEELHARLNGLLDALDHAEMHGPAAYVSMAIDTIHRDYPELSAIR